MVWFTGLLAVAVALTVAVALAVADAPRFARRASRSNSTPIAFHVHFKDRRVVHEAIDRCERHSGVREDTRPFAKLADLSARQRYQSEIDLNEEFLRLWYLEAAARS